MKELVMKNIFLHYIKISLALVLLLQAGRVSGQVCPGSDIYSFPTTINGVTITASTTGNATLGTSVIFSGTCVTLNSGSIRMLSSTGTSTGSVTLTFDKVVNNIIIKFNAASGSVSPAESYTFSVNNGTLTTASTTNCGLTISGNTYTGLLNSIITGDGIVQLTSTVPYSSITISGSGSPSNNGSLFAICGGSVAACTSGTSAPTLSATTLSASCPANTANLNSLVTSTTPTGATLKWYTDVARTTEVTTPTAVSVSGTYYAFYVDTVNNCYSTASSAVTVTANCPINVSTVCPAFSIDLASRVVSTAPSGYTLTYHSGTPATTANKLASSVVTTSGTYYLSAYFAAQDCYLNTGRPMVVTITNCCATVGAPNFN
jgi:hypothetical protein